MNQVELKILKKIKPTKIEQEIVEEFTDKLVKVAREISKPFYAYPMVVGSIAKNTWLRGDHDIDLFIVLRKKIKREQLEEQGLLIGTEICKKLDGIYNIKYAEHPYVRCEIGQFKIDIVPCYETQKGDKIISAVDRSPHHTRYIKEKLSGYMTDHVRLLKYFCKQIGVYGADAKNNGVSGYLCELLILYYKTFGNVLKEISKSNFGKVIDIDNLSNEKDAREKFKDALIVIDPVDKNRNVAAPLSAQNFLRFKIEAEKYLKVKKFPTKRKITRNLLIEKLKEDRNTRFIGVKFKPPQIIPENLYPQIRKFARKLAKYLESYDFKIMRYFSWTDEVEKSFIILEVENEKLSKFKKKEGPLIFSREVNNFLSKYLNSKYKPYIEDNKFFVDYERKFLDIETAIKKFLKENKKEIPDRIAEKKIIIFKEEEIIEEVNKNKELNSYLVKKYFSF